MRPWYQTFILVLAWAALGLASFGAILDAATNAVELVTPRVTHVGTAIVLIALTVAMVAIRRWPMPWSTSNGQRVKISKIGPKPVALCFGVVALLWLPVVTSRDARDIVHVTSGQAQKQTEPAATTVGPQLPPIIYYEDTTIPTALSHALLQAADLRLNPANIGKVGIRNNSEAFILHEQDEQLGPGSSITIVRDRSGANLRPLVQRMDFTAADATFQKIVHDWDEAIVSFQQVGSGGFLTLHILVWDRYRYVDLARDIGEEKACGAYSFADFDGDGAKELVITHCTWAVNRTTELYRIDRRSIEYAPVDPKSEFYRTFIMTTLQIQNDRPFDTETAYDDGHTPQLITPP